MRRASFLLDGEIDDRFQTDLHHITGRPPRDSAENGTDDRHPHSRTLRGACGSPDPRAEGSLKRTTARQLRSPSTLLAQQR
jgi:hypothetical protein